MNESIPLNPLIEKGQVNIEDEVNKIMENIPSELGEMVDLPSKCKFYTLPNPNEGITVTPMTFADEKAIVQASTKDSISILLSRCVKNVDVSELLQFDKLFLLLKIREISFGADYTVDVICEKCNVKNDLSFNISTFKIRHVPDDIEDPREITLEKLDKKAKVRFPRVADEEYLLSTDSIMNNLWRFVMEIDGHANKAIISKVIEKLPSKDVHILMNEIFGSSYGVDTKGKFMCDGCGHSQVAELPIGADFFTLS
jgi:hypothetical protein